MNNIKKAPLLGSDDDIEAIANRRVWQMENKKIMNAPCGSPLMSKDFSGYDLESRMMKESLEIAKSHLQRIPNRFDAITEKTFTSLNIRPLSSTMLKECTYHHGWGS